MDHGSNHPETQATDARGADHLSDEALMLGYAQGNVKAFEQLYHRHKDSLLRFFLRQVSARATADELFQETWQSLIKNSAKYQATAKFSTYLYRIAHSRLVDFYRKNGREHWLEFDEQLVDSVASGADASLAERRQRQWQPEAQHDELALKEQLFEALETLPENQREVFLLKFEAGMSVAEIANCLEQNAEAVKSRLRYATAKLKGFFNLDELKES